MALKTAKNIKYFYFLLLSLVVVSTNGCFFSDSDSASDTFNISGTISVNSATQVDSDVNDLFAPYAPNDSIAQAQVLKNPVTVGGFVATSNAMSFGRLSDGSSDLVDYYSISLVAQQPIYFFPGDAVGAVGDVSTCKTFDVHILDLCIALEDANGNAVTGATSSIQSNHIIITSQNTGNYYLRVQAEQRGRNYIIATGLPSSTMALQSNLASELNIRDNFIPGEVIVKFKDGFISAAGVASNNLAASVGLMAKAGAPDRSMLMSLGDNSNRTLTFSVLGVAAVKQQPDAESQLKQDTIEVVKALRNRADVEYAALNYIRRPLLEPNDSYYGLQWHYQQIAISLGKNYRES